MWGQNLSLHPHLHWIVPGGGVTKSGNWKHSKRDGKFLFPVKAMSKEWRAKYVAELRKSKVPIPQSDIHRMFTKPWVVFAKRPFGKPEHIVEYLGRYSHKIAISNHRILYIDHNRREVKFKLKNYRKDGKQATMTLGTQEFIRRFQLHILPKGFTRIRHYGILSSSWKKVKLPALQKLLSGNRRQDLQKSPNSTTHKICPTCKTGKLITIGTFDTRGPPIQLCLLINKGNR